MDARLAVRREGELFRYAVDNFERLVRLVTKRPRFCYKATRQDCSSWENWCERYGDRVLGEDFVNEYLEYGIQSWFNKGHEGEADYTKTIRFSWIFGSAAIKRFEVFDREARKSIVRGHLKTVVCSGLSTSSRKTSHSEMLNTIIEVEEREKQRYFNGKRGWAWCISNTTLYHHRSLLCTSCKYKDGCKELLKNEMKRVYRLRGYGE